MSEKDLFNRLKSEFLDWYEIDKHIPYYFTGKDAGNLKQLIKKIQFIGKEKHKEDDKSWVVDGFKWILGHLDEWTQKNVSIALINSRFNEIIANGRKKQPLRNISTEYITDVIKRSGFGNIQAEQPSNSNTDFRGKATGYRAIGKG